MKKLLLALSVLLITGCSVDYNITITNKEKVKEKFYVYVPNNEILESNKTVDEYLDYTKNMYKELPTAKGYTIKSKKANPSSYFKVTNNYKSLEEYVSSYTFKSMFDYANIEHEGKYTTVVTSKNAYLESLKTGELVSEEKKYDDFKISIKFYNEVVESNADEKDEKNNIYTWHVKEDDEQDFIYFKLGPKVKYNVMILDFIQTNLITIIVTTTLIIALAATAIYFYRTSKKNNEV